MSRQKIVAGNWKMNKSLQEAKTLVEQITNQVNEFDEVTKIIIPPFPFLEFVKSNITNKPNFYVGAQNCHTNSSGAFTGEVSASMLSSVGCEYVLVGHSERRANHNDDDAKINKKIKAALANELKPIFCIGEELAIREAGNHISFVLEQLRNGLKSFHKPDLKKIVIAYEPVWAIGTGKTATPEDAQEVCSAIRDELRKIGSDEIADNCRILYGGSVKSINTLDIMKEADVDGALVGGASLDPEEFARISKFHRVLNKA
jgi:triosephosphate isomerase